jgi:hypothetical protein
LFKPTAREEGVLKTLEHLAVNVTLIATATHMNHESTHKLRISFKKWVLRSLAIKAVLEYANTTNKFRQGGVQ